MKKNLMGLALSAAFAGALTLGAASAQALQITQVQAGGNLVDTSFSGGEELAVDFGFLSDAAVRLTVMLDGGETGLRFSSVLSELRPGRSLVAVRLDFSTLPMQAGSSLNLALAPLDVLAHPAQPNTFTVFSPQASTEYYLGDPLLQGATPWQATLAGLNAGSSFTLTVSAVPEPQTLALWLAGLALVRLGTGMKKQRRLG